MKNRCDNTKRNWFSIGDFGNFTCQKKGYNFVSHPAQLLTVILEPFTGMPLVFFFLTLTLTLTLVPNPSP